MTASDIVREKREEILAIARKHGAFNVRVFGSVARGDADEKSDIGIRNRIRDRIVAEAVAL